METCAYVCECENNHCNIKMLTKLLHYVLVEIVICSLVPSLQWYRLKTKHNLFSQKQNADSCSQHALTWYRCHHFTVLHYLILLHFIEFLHDLFNSVINIHLVIIRKCCPHRWTTVANMHVYMSPYVSKLSTSGIQWLPVLILPHKFTLAYIYTYTKIHNRITSISHQWFSVCASTDRRKHHLLHSA